jgi:hypothetical protein
MFPIIKSLMYLDGMVLRCRPQAVLMEDMRPFIGRLANLIDGPLAEADRPAEILRRGGEPVSGVVSAAA